jgi:hypothetical protein
MTERSSPPLDEALALSMARAQAELNSRRDPRWLDAGWPFLRAAVIEAARGLDRLDWKWWKREEGGPEGVAESLAVVWRHGLSHLIVERRGDLPAVAKYLAWSSRHGPGPVRMDDAIHHPGTRDLAGRLDLLVGLCSMGRFPLAVLADLFASCGVDWNALARRHLADCALLGFRLGCGQPEGAPVVFGDGREDREHLCELVPAFTGERPDGCERLRLALVERRASLASPG